MRLLGIDPGFDRTGIGVIDQSGNRLVWVYHGCIQTRAQDPFSLRLQQTRDGIRLVLDEFKPEAAVVEELFFQNNAKTAIKVGMARGVVIITLADANIPVIELTPNQVKQGITGWGAADKKQIQEMVKRLLNLKEIPKPDDAADALALAIVGGPLVALQAAKVASGKKSL
jgi:crossover junction endodeoxyribonuclease RuvC